jgi:hypothetical protein
MTPTLDEFPKEPTDLTGSESYGTEAHISGQIEKYKT